MTKIRNLTLAAVLAAAAVPAFAASPMMGPNYWVMIGSTTFSGTIDKDAAAGGWAGRKITHLAFKAVDGDAVCTRINVAFANGNKQQLSISRLPRGTITVANLNGNARNVTNVAMRCRSAAGQRGVTVLIFGNKA